MQVSQRSASLMPFALTVPCPYASRGCPGARKQYKPLALESPARSILLAGPFQSLIFADSICSLASAAPLVYITKPWHYASWKIVVTLLAFQVYATMITSELPPAEILDCMHNLRSQSS